MVKTIFRNLINNAIKFTHENGRIKIWYEHKNQFVRIFVKDTGIGIDRNKLKLLFEIGHEKVIPGTAGEESTGLGLSVCKEFVRAMEGNIRAESEAGLGSQFTVELLVYDPQVHPTQYKPVQKTTVPSVLSN